MTQTAIIGGSGLTDPQYLEVSRREVVGTPYGDPSAPLLYGNLNGHEVVFLPRHGAGHSIPPHEINYRANVWALQRAGAANVIAINAVGAIKHGLEVAGLMIPDQIIDYTYGRQHTFFEGEHREVTHVDFSEPYCAALRKILIAAAKGANVDVNERGTYGATQGPRFESAAEIRRMERDGADIVGMTGMPEAGLARELDLCYASLTVVVNPAAGKAEGGINLKEVEKNLEAGMAKVRAVLERAVDMLS